MDNSKPGQVLLISLVVMSILSIILFALVITISTSTEQVFTTSQYNQAYLSGETSIKRIIDGISNRADGISILTAQSECQEIIPSREAECVYLYEQEDLDTVYNSFVRIRDSSSVLNYELQKDETLVIHTNNVRDVMNFDISNNIALEFQLIIQSSGRYHNLVDVYDVGSNITSAQGQSSANLPNSFNRFPFVTVPIRNNAFASFQFSINTVLQEMGFSPATVIVEDILVSPRSNRDVPSTNLSFFANNPGTFPLQMREIVSSTRDQTLDNSAVVTLISQIPLNAQFNSNMIYGIITENGL